MPRPEKVQAVEEIKERFEKAEATFLTEYRGLSVNEQQELRRGLRAADADYKVVKMSLARRAAEDLGLDEITESMIGPTAIAFANADPVPVAKALKDFAKTHEHLVLKVGLMSGKVLAPEQISKLAEIEPRDVLLGKIAGAAKAPLTKMAGMLGSFLRDSASMFSQLLEKKETNEPVSIEEVEADATTEPEAAEEAVDTAPDEDPAAEAADESTEVEADESVDTDVAEPEAEAAAQEEEPSADVENTSASAEAEEGSEESSESDDTSDSDSDSDDPATAAKEE